MESMTYVLNTQTEKLFYRKNLRMKSFTDQ
jgi:hypothetical protein